jgi:hypothetical protein
MSQGNFQFSDLSGLFAFDSAWKDWQVFVLMILLTSPIILLRFKRMRGGSGGGSCGGGGGSCGGGGGSCGGGGGSCGGGCGGCGGGD